MATWDLHQKNKFHLSCNLFCTKNKSPLHLIDSFVQESFKRNLREMASVAWISSS